MKPIKNQASSIAGLSSLSAETKLCFGAAGGCAIIGSGGYAVNALTTTETTLSAFLVISVFYVMLGVISLFKSSPDYVTVQKRQPHPLAEDEEELIESAA
jgi:hypothetical protein